MFVCAVLCGCCYYCYDFFDDHHRKRWTKIILNPDISWIYTYSANESKIWFLEFIGYRTQRKQYFFVCLFVWMYTLNLVYLTVRIKFEKYHLQNEKKWWNVSPFFRTRKNELDEVKARESNNMKKEQLEPYVVHKMCQ